MVKETGARATAFPLPAARILRERSSRFYTWLTGLRGAKRLGFAWFCGVMAAFALPPFYLLPLMFFSLPALVRLLDGIAENSAVAGSSGRAAPIYAAPMQAALTGWFFGFGYFTAGLWWLADAMTVDLAQFWWAIPFAVFGLPAFLSFYYALATLSAFFFWRRGLSRIAALALAFAGAEYLRGILFTGFPWNAIGLTIMPSPLFMQADAALTQNGMNAAAVFFCALPALWLPNTAFNRRRSARSAIFLFFGLAAADISFGAYRLYCAAPPAPATELRVRLVQPAIAQEEKQSDAAREENFTRLLRLTSAAPKNGGQTPELIIWPETAMPYLPDYNQAALARIGAVLQPGQVLLAGAVRVEARDSNQQEETDNAAAANYRFFNSAMLINAGGQILSYADKTHLVPFGEYLPLGRWLRAFHLSALAQAAGPYSAAASRRLIRLPNGISILPLICYEAIFPRESEPVNGEKADIIVNITNDAWFGRTPGPYQHLAQARLRAIEQNRPLIRVANTGISAYIDARGRILARLPLSAEGFLDINAAAQAK